MTSKQEKRRQKLERKTARVFFSSPFGGLEEEREELTKKYWPQLESMCNRAGYDFIPVDLRWGITSEMSSSAVTIKVCLNEMDRSDMIVGFFGQRYGWHGDNELLQKSFDVAAEYYPWLNEYREKSVTELEYLHGHLRNPGARAACFFFRDKAYDDMKLKDAQEKGDEREIRKFIASTDGPHAAERLDDLKQRIAATKDKCLDVHMSYTNPKEGARLMFETIEKYFNDVLLARPSLQLTPRDEENLQHEVFLASRLGMGGVYVGGDKYFDMVDKFLTNADDHGKTKTALILGSAGSGKSCFLSNWITHQQSINPDAIVVYHFIGSTSGGRDPRIILTRLVDELHDQLSEKVVQDESLKSSKNDEVHNLVRKLHGLMSRVKTEGCKAYIIIDALNKVKESGQTMKPLYWLPKDLPDNVYFILSTLTSDKESVEELKERDCHVITMKPLDIKEREEMALAALKKRGKTFSTEQRNKIFQKQQTENPLYLETLLKELVSFGEFFQLDKYIDSLIQANDTVGLFLKFLERLEKDYNPDDYDGNMTEEIMCCIHVSRQGLSESEIKSILNISNQAWSSVFFAMDDFLTESNGLYSFAYDELGSAVSKRYLEDIENKTRYIGIVADYFEAKLKERSDLYNTTIPERVYMELPYLLKKLDDKERLINCLLKPPMFYSLRSGENMYDLINYWNCTGLSGKEIVDRHTKVIDDQLTLFYNEGIEQGHSGNYPLTKAIPYVYELAQFLGNAGHTAAALPITERVLQMQKTVHTADEIKNDPGVALDYVNVANTLACMYVDTEEFSKGEQLHKEVLELEQKYETVFDEGKRQLAKTFNGLGVLMFRQSKCQEALDYYQQSIDKHREGNSPPQEVADILNNQGAVYHLLGQWDDAVKVFTESLEIYEEAYFGRLPADVGGTILNLAMAYRRLERYEEAEPLYLRALQIRENAYGLNHHEVGQTLLSYAALCLNTNPAKAAEISKRAADIYEESFGLDHINTLNALENIALAYLFLQKPQEAHPYFKRAGERKEATDRIDTSIQRMNAVMADHYLNSGQNDEARLLFRRIVKANFATDRDFAALDYLDCELPTNKRPKRPREQTIYHGIEKFPNSVMILGRLQVHYSEKGKADEMLHVLEKGEFGVEHYNNAYQAFVENKHKRAGIKLLEIAHVKFPKDTIILHNLASAHLSYKDYLKSAAYFKNLFDLDPSDVTCLESYAKAVSLAGRPHEARDLYEKAVKLAEKSDDHELIKRLHASMKLLNEM